MFGIENAARDMLFRLNGKQFADAFNLVNRLRWKLPIGLEYLQQDGVFSVSDLSTHGTTPSTIAFARKERIWAYRQGVQARINTLGGVYSLDHCEIGSDDTVIDCGANVGEFSALITARFKCRVIAVEPETAEARCIRHNAPGVTAVVNAALWSECKELQFFSKNRTADSSLFETEGYDSVVRVRAFTIDQLAKDHGLTRIKLFKLEAEGAEPEILQGALEMLPMIEYISADLGPERGMEQASTVVPVCNFLFSKGFELVAHYHRRQVFLFRNRSATRQRDI